MSVSAIAYEQLRARLVSGDLAPGARLAELPLAKQLAVSRPTIREALRRLESQGLATSDGRSLRVSQLDWPELRSALLMRTALESLHAELAAERVREGHVAPAQLRRLLELAQRAERSTEAGRYADAVEDNRAFHQAVDALAASPISEAAVDRLWDLIMVATERSLTRPGRRTLVAREHRELLDAIGAGDCERAAEVARRHVLGTLEASRPDAQPESSRFTASSSQRSPTPGSSGTST
jgi:DNA-binding GntR family transcriptional regulator